VNTHTAARGHTYFQPVVSRQSDHGFDHQSELQLQIESQLEKEIGADDKWLRGAQCSFYSARLRFIELSKKYFGHTTRIDRGIVAM
jgi:hypothetical protein